MNDHHTKKPVFEVNGLRISLLEERSYKLECGSLFLEFALPGGSLEVRGIGTADPDSRLSWKGHPPAPDNPVLWAEGAPAFRSGTSSRDTRTVEAIWTRGDLFFKWSFAVYPDFSCLEARASASRGWLECCLGKNPASAGRSGSPQSFATIEKEAVAANAVSGTDLLATIGISNRHLRLKGVHLHDITDIFDFLVEEKSLHSGRLGGHGFAGNLLEIEDLQTGGGLLVARMAPTPEAQFARSHKADFQWVNQGGVAVYGTGLQAGGLPESESVSSYGLVLLPARSGELQKRWRSFYRSRMQPRVFSRPLSLSNTWGDRNQDAALNEAFAAREIRALSQTGLGGLMLDDGWQAGITTNSKVRKGGVWEGYHDLAEPFWEVHSQKFPHGLAPLVELAGTMGKELALWFSPDSSNDFLNWEKDAAILLGLFREHGIRAFKLDGIKLRSRLGEQRFGAFLDAIGEGSGGRIVPILDVTSEIRQGFFREIDHGILFLENRYTDWGNYFPYRTLRNVWQLSRWIPAQRLHIEFLNPRRNRNRYEGDPFGPENYPMSYLFAITMVGHPLAWMEVQYLDPADLEAIREVSEWHREHHQWLMSADIEPVGQLPDGTSWSGFAFHFPDGQEALLVFRDNSGDNRAIFPVREGCDIKFIIGSSEATVSRIDGESVEVRLEKPRSWALLGPGA